MARRRQRASRAMGRRFPVAVVDAAFCRRHSPHSVCVETKMAQSLDLLQGTVDVLILKTLSWEPMHGYGIAKWVEQRSEGVLGVADAALYQAPHRLERRGLIASEWRLSENNRKAKYYHLTAAGRPHLRNQLLQIRRHVP